MIEGRMQRGRVPRPVVAAAAQRNLVRLHCFLAPQPSRPQRGESPKGLVGTWHRTDDRRDRNLFFDELRKVFETAFVDADTAAFRNLFRPRFTRDR